jgi:peptidoglycan hydrolase-like protein with peptidoglycan-binding domain
VKRLWIGIPVAVIVITAIAVAAILQPWRAPAAESSDGDEPATVVAETTTLTSNLLLNGSLSYGDEISLPGRNGTVTGLPTAGSEVAVGQALYEVDGKPVIAVRGSRPFWRSLERGMSDGPDVTQLEQALVDFGFGSAITVDQEFTWSTAAAVKAWQKALGLERTGSIALGDIVAVDAGSVRVAAVTARLGDEAMQSPLSYTSPVLRVVATLTDAQAREIVPATVVAVRLPDGTELPGAITEVDPGGDPTDVEGETTSATATVDLDDPAAATGIGLRAVKVVLASESVEDALVIPVTALLATLDGGYAVDVIRGDRTVRLPVEVGLIADARVQIVGGELVEGDVVVVAT